MLKKDGEFMNILLFQQITFFSSLLGCLLALVTLIPFIGQIGFFILMCFASVIVLFLMMKLELIEFYEIRESVIVGALIGMISYIAFSIIYIPIVIILMRFFGLYTNYGVSLILSTASFWILIVLTVFMAVLSATLNAFSAFLTYYVSEVLKSMKHDNQQNSNDEQFKL